MISVRNETSLSHMNWICADNVKGTENNCTLWSKNVRRPYNIRLRRYDVNEDEPSDCRKVECSHRSCLGKGQCTTV